MYDSVDVLLLRMAGGETYAPEPQFLLNGAVAAFRAQPNLKFPILGRYTWMAAELIRLLTPAEQRNLRGDFLLTCDLQGRDVVLITPDAENFNAVGTLLLLSKSGGIRKKLA